MQTALNLPVFLLPIFSLPEGVFLTGGKTKLLGKKGTQLLTLGST